MGAQQTTYQSSGLFGPTVVYRTHYRLNDTAVSNANRSNNNGSAQGVNGESHLILTTMKLEKDDKVAIKMGGYIWKFDDPKTTYFEGRLVSVINE